MRKTAEHEDPGASSAGVHIEVHHDGTVVLGVELDSRHWRDGDPPKAPLVLPWAQQFARELVVLEHVVAKQRGVLSPALARVEVCNGTSLPLALIGRYAFSDGLRQLPGSRDVRRFRPVRQVLPRVDSPDLIPDTDAHLLRDVCAQFGYDTVSD